MHARSLSTGDKNDEIHLQTGGMPIKLASGDVSGLYKKLSYRRVTARCVLSVVILPITTQQYRNYLAYTTSPDQTDGMKLEV